MNRLRRIIIRFLEWLAWVLFGSEPEVTFRAEFGTPRQKGRTQ